MIIKLNKFPKFNFNKSDHYRHSIKGGLLSFFAFYGDSLKHDLNLFLCKSEIILNPGS
jgi:hypothetical protein